MIICKTQNQLQLILNQKKADGDLIGFVPTMGALHKGHLSLIEAAALKTQFVVCSIYVNPSQFNDKQDLEKYPRTTDNDIKQLLQTKCDLLFLPDDQTMYPDGIDTLIHFDLGELEHIHEGKFRPGHFQGVANVVSLFLKIVKPDFLFMGQKDFQQVKVIEQLLKTYFHQTINLVMCPIEREPDGLAMSSRNIRLKKEDRFNAPRIFETLKWMKSHATKLSFYELRKQAIEKLNQIPNSVTEYLEICDSGTLQPIENFSSKQSTVALTVVNLGGVRLLDNVLL